MEPLLTTSKEGWTSVQKILIFLLVASLLMNVGTLTIVAVIGAHIFDVTSSDSLCRTANTCLAKANVQLQDALVATLDPAAWGRVAGDVAQLAKQLKTVNWTMEASQKCDFMVYCRALTSVDCGIFVGDRGGKCEWVDGQCQTPATQGWETSKAMESQPVGCNFFSGMTPCQYAVPISPAGRCTWDSGMNRCTDADPQNPGRVMATCSETYSIDNRTSSDINDAISRTESMMNSYRSNSTHTGVESSLDITQYIARQLESNWTLTTDTCAALARSLLQMNTSLFACQPELPNCDSWAAWQVYVQTANILCDKVKNLHLVVKQQPVV